MIRIVATFFGPLAFMAILLGCIKQSVTTSLLETEQTPQLSLVEDSDSIRISFAEKPVLSYHKTTRFPGIGNPSYYQRSGFIHPLFAPNGTILTDDFPVGHIHQHGVFLALVKTRIGNRSHDFWNQQNHTGTIIHDTITEIFIESDHVGFEARLQHLAIAGQDTFVAINESWIVSVKNSGYPFVIDFVSIMQSAISDTIVVEPYHYGGFALRGPRQWYDSEILKNEGEVGLNYIGTDGKGGFLTDDGKTRLNGNHSNAKWVSFIGSISGRKSGVTVLSHPSNFRYPEKVRIHPVMPYFCFAPMAEGGYLIMPGQSYQTKYRILTYEDFPGNQELEKWHLAFIKD